MHIPGKGQLLFLRDLKNVGRVMFVVAKIFDHQVAIKKNTFYHIHRVTGWTYLSLNLTGQFLHFILSAI